jgi:Fe-S cluster assembly protein SufB
MSMREDTDLKNIIGLTTAEEILGEREIGRDKLVIKGRISPDLIDEISRRKKEPDWMRRMRRMYLEIFNKLSTPQWLEGIEELDLDELSYYVDPGVERRFSWEEIPKDIAEAYESLALRKLRPSFC